jgi:hypothetical protein
MTLAIMLPTATLFLPANRKRSPSGFLKTETHWQGSFDLIFVKQNETHTNTFSAKYQLTDVMCAPKFIYSLGTVCRDNANTKSNSVGLISVGSNRSSLSKRESFTIFLWSYIRQCFKVQLLQHVLQSLKFQKYTFCTPNIVPQLA